MLFLLAACAPVAESPDVSDTATDRATTDDTDLPGVTPDPPLPWTDDPCVGIPTTGTSFTSEVARFRDQDDAAPPPPGQLVVVGSSSIRRWEDAFRDLAPWGVIQRGLGGAHMTDIAAWTNDLVVRHRPAGVLVYAGTNDVDAGRSAEEVVTAWRCLVQRVHDGLGPVPVILAGLAPNPARWGQRDAQAAVNTEIQRLSALHPRLDYVDVPAAFLNTGAPPDAALFVDDGLHLSPAGYDLWTSTILPVVSAMLPARPAPSPAEVAAGAYLRVDFGPSNAEDGAPAPTPDGFGLTWNAWHPARGGDQVLAGEALRGLRTTAGAATGIDLVITGGFRANGLRNGGLTSPSYDLLGTMAVPGATQDFFYTEGADDPAGLAFTGLDPARTYTLRLFASRATDAERRVTRYIVDGAATASADLLTSGADIGRDGYDGNDSEVLTLTDLRPDEWGQLYVDVQRLEGTFAYLSLLELEIAP